jgi:hypothetical protein
MMVVTAKAPFCYMHFQYLIVRYPPGIQFVKGFFIGDVRLKDHTAILTFLQNEHFSLQSTRIRMTLLAVE